MAAMRGFAVAALALAGLLSRGRRSPNASTSRCSTPSTLPAQVRAQARRPTTSSWSASTTRPSRRSRAASACGTSRSAGAGEDRRRAAARRSGSTSRCPTARTTAMRPGLDRALMTGLVDRARERPAGGRARHRFAHAVGARRSTCRSSPCCGEERLGHHPLRPRCRRHHAALLARHPHRRRRLPDARGPPVPGVQQKRCRDGLIDFALGEPFRYVPLHEVLKTEDTQLPGEALPRPHRDARRDAALQRPHRGAGEPRRLGDARSATARASWCTPRRCVPRCRATPPEASASPSSCPAGRRPRPAGADAQLAPRLRDRRRGGRALPGGGDVRAAPRARRRCGRGPLHAGARVDRRARRTRPGTSAASASGCAAPSAAT